MIVASVHDFRIMFIHSDIVTILTSMGVKEEGGEPDVDDGPLPSAVEDF